MKLILLCFLLQLDLRVFAQACDKYKAYTRNLSVEGPGVSELIRNDQNLGPIRDQNGVGSCYAYAASDLLEVWLKSKGKLPKNRQLSPMAIFFIDNYDHWNKLTRRNFSRLLQIEKDIVSPFNDLGEEINNLHTKLEKLKNNDELDWWTYFKREISLDGTRRLLTLKALYWQFIYSGKLDLYRTANNPTSFDDGGFSHLAIERALKKKILCLESEVNSRDEKIKSLYKEDKNQELFSMTRHNNYLLDSISTLSTSHIDQYEDDRCKSFYLANAIFPNLFLQSFQDFDNILKKIDDDNNIFDELLKKSCTSLSIGSGPKIKFKKVYEAAKFYPDQLKNNYLFTLIDKSLKDGGIAAVSYFPEILENDILKRISGKTAYAHTSSIVGSLKLCGEKYYILRNSYGEDDCEIKRTNFTPSPKTQINKTELEQCIERATKKRNSAQSRCSISECLPNDQGTLVCRPPEGCPDNYDDIWKIYLRESQNCSSRYKGQKWSRLISHPYFCDSKGNYIISKKQLERGLFDATVLVDQFDQSSLF